MLSKQQITLIIPGRAPFELPDRDNEGEIKLLEGNLRKLGLANPKPYLDHYDQKNQSMEHTLSSTSEAGHDHGKALGSAPHRSFPSFTNPDGLADYILTQLEMRAEKMKQEKARRDAGGVPNESIEVEFKNRDDFHDDPHEEYYDCKPARIPIPESMKKVKEIVRDNLEKLARTNQKKKKFPDKSQAIDPQIALEKWIRTDLLRKLLKDVSMVAAFGDEKGKGKGIIFHETHHDLNPGMLLVDELFKALVSRVAETIQEINQTTERTMATKPDLTPLNKLVDALNGVGIPNEFASYILPPGSKTLHGEVADPTRVELVLDGPWINAATTIVGAWKGGTHSNGSTHSS